MKKEAMAWHSLTPQAQKLLTVGGAAANKPGWISRAFKKVFRTNPNTQKVKVKRQLEDPSWISRHKTKITWPLGVGGVGYIGGNLIGIPGADLQPHPASLPEAPAGTSTELSTPLTGVQSALIGGTAGGLGSLLYGTLADKPDLRRDLIATLLGGVAGGAYHLLSSQKSGATANAIEINARTATLDKEAVGFLLGAIPWAGRAAVAAWPHASRAAMALMAATMVADWGTDYRQESKKQKQTERHAGQAQRMHDEAIKEYKGLQQSQLALSQAEDKLRRGAGGALAGGAVGGLVSNIAGKAMDRESLRRDILATLGGAAIGGVAGVYSAA